MDSISIERIKTLHPAIRDKVIAVLQDCDNCGIRIRITQGLRTFEEQDSLYAQSRTLPGPCVTNARAGQSWHNYGLAFDFCLMNEDGSISWDKDCDSWQKVVRIAKSHDFEWGGDWTHPDYPHLQERFGLTIEQAYNLYCDGNVDQNGYIRIAGC